MKQHFAKYWGWYAGAVAVILVALNWDTIKGWFTSTPSDGNNSKRQIDCRYGSDDTHSKCCNKYPDALGCASAKIIVTPIVTRPSVGVPIVTSGGRPRG